MSQPAIDRRNLPDDLMSAGFGDRQATAIADAITAACQGLATQASLDHMRAEMKNFETRMTNFESHTNGQFALVNRQLESLEGRVDNLNTKINNVDAKVDNLDAKFTAKVDSLDAKVDNVSMNIDNLAQVLGNKFDSAIDNHVRDRWILGIVWITTLAIFGTLTQFQFLN